MLCSRLMETPLLLVLFQGPQMHATPRLQQGLRESKFHRHWVPFEGKLR
jgi:hypothetical protein